MNKKLLRNSITDDIDSYIKSGGVIKIEKTYTRKPRNTASGKQKQYFKSVIPRMRPSLMYDFIETKS